MRTAALIVITVIAIGFACAALLGLVAGCASTPAPVQARAPLAPTCEWTEYRPDPCTLCFCRTDDACLCAPVCAEPGATL